MGSSSGTTSLRSSEELWEYMGNQMKLLRSFLMIWSWDTKKMETDLRRLLEECLELYSSFLATSSQVNAMCIFSGRKRSSLEPAFMWLGGWRPTSAIILVFSIMGIESPGGSKTESESHRGTPMLTERQLYSLNSLQAHTQQAEHDLSNQLGHVQMLVADQNVVAAVSSNNWSDTKVAMEERISELKDLFRKADSLRSQTLHELFSVLDPVQAAKWSVTAFELAFVVKTFPGTLIKSRALKTDVCEGVAGSSRSNLQDMPCLEDKASSERTDALDCHPLSVEDKQTLASSSEGFSDERKRDS